jgi:hypothetical protein
MKISSKYFKYQYLVVCLISLFIYLGISMCNVKNNKKDSNGYITYGPNDKYVGSRTCITCHKEIYNSYINTAHYNTSAVVDSTSIASGYYKTGDTYYRDDLFVSVHKAADGLYQTAHSEGRIAASHRMELVIGSGRKGQTFLFWNDSSIYQLPLSYSYAYDRWINSPGYAAGKVMFNRLISVKCFVCHSSYADQKINDSGKPIFDSSRLVLTISCETCHGPAAKHVQYHQQNTTDSNPSFIINAAALSRQQQLEACASCHSGIRENIKPAFSFLPGDKLDDFFKPAYSKDSVAELDVHGNQYGLLSASKCFMQSVTLNCSSCHNVHKKERDMMQAFAQRCMNCHTQEEKSFCSVKNTDHQTLVNNCIDCHMPKQASNQITFNTGNSTKLLYDSIRTHLIGIYNDRKD